MVQALVSDWSVGRLFLALQAYHQAHCQSFSMGLPFDSMLSTSASTSSFPQPQPQPPPECPNASYSSSAPPPTSHGPTEKDMSLFDFIKALCNKNV